MKPQTSSSSQTAKLGHGKALEATRVLPRLVRPLPKHLEAIRPSSNEPSAPSQNSNSPPPKATIALTSLEPEEAPRSQHSLGRQSPNPKSYNITSFPILFQFPFSFCLFHTYLIEEQGDQVGLAPGMRGSIAQRITRVLPGSYGGLVGVIFDCDREVLFSLIGSLVLRVEEDERSITAHSLILITALYHFLVTESSTSSK